MSTPKLSHSVLPSVGVLGPGCASATSHHFPREYLGEERLIDIVPPVRKWEPASVTVRYTGPDSALVRIRTDAAPGGIQLQVFFAERANARWKVDASKEGPLGCADLEPEFARPDEELSLG